MFDRTRQFYKNKSSNFENDQIRPWTLRKEGSAPNNWRQNLVIGDKIDVLLSID